MSVTRDDAAEAFVAFASGAIVGVVATLLLLRMQGKRSVGSGENDDDYCYDGGDLFI